MYRTAIGGLISTAVLLAGCASFGSAQLASQGRLADCGEGPHCVSSQATDPKRLVQPIRYAGSREGAQQLMSKIVAGLEGAQIVHEEPGYIHATFSSKVFGFVDDVELQFPMQKWIDVRSASRFGYYDLDKNRERVEILRQAFEDRQP